MGIYGPLFRLTHLQVVVSAGNPTGSPAVSDCWGAPTVRHLETSNVGFADGHVKAVRLEKVYYANTPYFDPKCGGGTDSNGIVHSACP